MADEHRLQTEYEAGQRAKSLLENRALVEAFERIEADYTAAWRETAPGQTQEREDAYQGLRALDKLRRDLEAVISGGTIAEAQLRRMFKSPHK